jgi:3-oxoadipate enol-lactonase
MDNRRDDRSQLREIWFESKGRVLFACEQGAGTPLVFLHGGLADHRAALQRVGPLAAAHRLVTPDMRGSGRSHFAGELSWDLLADDLAALLGHLELDGAIVGGTSMGSGAALRFALRHPQLTRGLLLHAPVYAGGALGLNPAQRAAMAAMNEHGKRARLVGMEALRPLFERLPEAVRERALAMMLSFDPASVAATTRFLASGRQPFEELSELSAVAAKTLLVCDDDPEHPAELCRLYAAQLPDCTAINGLTTLTASFAMFG